MTGITVSKLWLMELEFPFVIGRRYIARPVLRPRNRSKINEQKTNLL